MSEQDTDLTTPTDDDSSLVQQLRKEIAARDKALAEERSERIVAQKDSLFQKAGLDPTNGIGRLLYETYDGDLTLEALQAKTKEYGIDVTSPTAPATTPEETRSDQSEAHQKIDQSTDNQKAADSMSDPDAKARVAYEETFSATGDNETAMAAFFNAKLGATVESMKQGR